LLDCLEQLRQVVMTGVPVIRGPVLMVSGLVIVGCDVRPARLFRPPT
jgi:hypothetical protein